MTCRSDMNLDALEAMLEKAEKRGACQWLPVTEADLDLAGAMHNALPELIAAARRLEALEKAIADGKASMPAERAFDWMSERAAAIAGKGGAA